MFDNVARSVALITIVLTTDQSVDSPGIGRNVIRSFLEFGKGGRIARTAATLVDTGCGVELVLSDVIL